MCDHWGVSEGAGVAVDIGDPWVGWVGGLGVE